MTSNSVALATIYRRELQYKHTVGMYAVSTSVQAFNFVLKKRRRSDGQSVFVHR
jgi:hypothetical protein